MNKYSVSGSDKYLKNNKEVKKEKRKGKKKKKGQICKYIHRELGVLQMNFYASSQKDSLRR